MAAKHVIEKIRELAEMVELDHAHRGVLSTGERIAVAIVLRRMDWLQEDGFENLDAACDRIGDEWAHACQAVIKLRTAARLRVVEK